MRIDKEIINPKYHVANKNIIKDKFYIDKFLTEDQTVKYLLEDNSKYRIFDLVGEQNRWAAFNIENVRGYHPAKLSIYNRLMNDINTAGFNIWPIGILNLLNVKYLIIPESNFQHPLFVSDTTRFMNYFGYSPKYDGQEIKVSVYENRSVLPRLFYTRSIENLYSNEINDKLLHDSFRPEIKSYVDNENLKDSYVFLGDNPFVEIGYYSPNKILFTTNTKSEQFLVISEIYFPFGWSISDGSKNYEIYKVNDLVRGIFVPPGHKKFIMSFNPSDLFVSKILSIIIISSLIITIMYSYLKGRKNA